MRPPFLLSWLSKIDLTADDAVAESRWKLATSVAKKANRKQVAAIIRIFLFASPSAEELVKLSSLLIEEDKNFAHGDKSEYVRLMAGLIALAAVLENTDRANAFALGINSANFPQGRSTPVHAAIVEELVKFTYQEGNRLRPSDFATSSDKSIFAAKLNEFGAAFVIQNDKDEQKNQTEAFVDELDTLYGTQIRRLAEETSILWWLLSGYSPSFGKPTHSLEDVEYALPAAAEVAERTQVLPSAPSIHAILTKALDSAKHKKGKKYTLSDVVAVSDNSWRTKFIVEHSISDCADLVPITTAIFKFEDLGSIAGLDTALAKSCPGVEANSPLLPASASIQFYNELVFLRAISSLG